MHMRKGRSAAGQGTLIHLRIQKSVVCSSLRLILLGAWSEADLPEDEDILQTAYIDVLLQAISADCSYEYDPPPPSGILCSAISPLADAG